MTDIILNSGAVQAFDSLAVFPSSASGGTLAVAKDTDSLYEFDEVTSTWKLIGPGGGGGSVTSVAVTVPSILTVSGSPITTAGTIAIDLANESAAQVFAGPIAGIATQPTFRALTATDIPNIAESQVINLVSDLAGKQPTGNYITALTNDVSAAGPGSAAATVNSVGGSSAANINTAVSLVNGVEPVNVVFAGPASGSPVAPTFRSLVSNDIPSLSGIYVTQSEVGIANGVASLDSGGKVPLAQLPSTLMEYKGTWDPTTNTPTLIDGTGVSGYVYWISAAFAGPVSGLNNSSMNNFQIGDLVMYNGAQWQLTTPAAGVQSVNGLQGVVVVNAINQLTGDVTAPAASGSQSKTATVVSVGGSTAANIFSAEQKVNNVETANQVFAGPATGSPAAPTYRSLVAADIPSISSGLTGTLPASNGGAAPVTFEFYVDKNRADTYTPTGSYGKPYLTIQAAITQAATVATIINPAIVKILPGTYTENLTLVPFVYVQGNGIEYQYQSVILNGTITANLSVVNARTGISDISVTSGTGVGLTVSGSTLFRCFVNKVNFSSSTAAAIVVSNSNAGTTLVTVDCLATVSTSGDVVTITGGAIQDTRSTFTAPSNTARALNCSAGSGSFAFSDIAGYIESSATGALSVSGARITSGSAAAVICNGSGVNVDVQTIINSTATNVVVGSGTFVPGNLIYTNTGTGLAATLNGGAGGRNFILKQDTNALYTPATPGNWSPAPTNVYGALDTVSNIVATAVVKSVSAVGAVPNANAATVTGTVLNLQPANASFPGVVTTGTQSFAGVKTFTGDVIASTDITLSGSQFTSTKIGETLARIRSTGLNSGGLLSVNIGNNTLFDLSAGQGQIVDYSIPATPTITNITFGPFSAQTVTGLATQDFTFILISPAGAIVQLSNFPTAVQRRQNIFIGRLSHASRTSIRFATSLPDFTQSPLSQLYDLFDALGPFNISGNVVSPNGANLNINTSSGSGFFRAFNYPSDSNTPNVVSFVGQTAATFAYATRTGTFGAGTTTADPSHYDVAGTITAIPGGTNTSTIQRVFLIPNGVYLIQYGQTTYSSLANAVAAIGTDVFIENPALSGIAVLIGYLVATKGATLLNNTGQAQFFIAPKFVGGVGGGSNNVTSLQQTYQASVQPQIILTSALGGLEVFDNSTPLGTSLFQIADNAGTTNYLNVLATGTTVNQLIDSGLTANTVPYANGSKQLTSSAVTPTELGYVSGVTSSIQTQINGKVSTTTWATYTPTVTGFGTVTNLKGTYRASGDSLKIKIFFTAGTVAASLASFTLPGGFTLSTDTTNKIPLSNIASASGLNVGSYASNSAAGTNFGTWYGAVVTAPATSTSLIYCGLSVTDRGNKLIAANGNAISETSSDFSLECEVILV